MKFNDNPNSNKFEQCGRLKLLRVTIDLVKYSGLCILIYQCIIVGPTLKSNILKCMTLAIRVYFILPLKPTRRSSLHKRFITPRFHPSYVSDIRIKIQTEVAFGFKCELIS